MITNTLTIFVFGYIHVFLITTFHIRNDFPLIKLVASLLTWHLLEIGDN